MVIPLASFFGMGGSGEGWRMHPLVKNRDASLHTYKNFFGLRTSLSRTTPGKSHLTQCHNSEHVPGYLVSWLGFEAGVSRIPLRRVRAWGTFSFSVTVRVTIQQDIM